MQSDLISRPSPLRPRQQQHPATEGPPGGGVGTAIEPLLVHFFGGPPPVRFEFWDGTFLGPAQGNTIAVRSPDAVRRLLWAPGELGLARAFVMGDLAFEGDIFEILAALHAASPERIHVGSRLPWQALQAARRLGVIGRPTAASTGGGGAAGPAALAASRRPGGAAPLRRQQRLLRHGARAGHDVLLRPVRPGDRHARGRTGVQARPRLPQARAGRPARDSGSSMSAAAGAPSPSTRPGTTAHGWSG